METQGPRKLEFITVDDPSEMSGTELHGNWPLVLTWAAGPWP